MVRKEEKALRCLWLCYPTKGCGTWTFMVSCGTGASAPHLPGWWTLCFTSVTFASVVREKLWFWVQIFTFAHASAAGLMVLFFRLWKATQYLAWNRIGPDWSWFWGYTIRRNFKFCTLLRFINFWLCWVFLSACRLSLVAGSKDCFLVAVHGLLTAVGSLVAEHGL